MKKSSFFFLFVILTELSCASFTPQKLKIEIPNKPLLNLNPYKEIVITHFWIEKEVKDFDLNQELINYFQEELRQKFSGKLSIKNIALEKEDVFKNQEFWKQLSPEAKEALFLTGKAEFTQEVHKALLKRDKTEIDGPFAPEKAWAEQKHFSLKLSLSLVSAETGEVILEKDYQETINYQNLKQPAEFAFFDLMKKIKLKFSRDIFATKKIQERYILLK